MGTEIKDEIDIFQENLRKEFKDNNIKVTKNNNVYTITFSNGKQYTYDQNKTTSKLPDINNQ